MCSGRCGLFRAWWLSHLSSCSGQGDPQWWCKDSNLLGLDTILICKWLLICMALYRSKKGKLSVVQAYVAQRVGRGIALLFDDRSTRRGWVVSSTPWPHFTPGKDQVPILQEAGWAPGPVWTGGKSRPHRDSIPDRPARSQSLYRLSYPAHIISQYSVKFLSKRVGEYSAVGSPRTLDTLTLSLQGVSCWVWVD